MPGLVDCTGQDWSYSKEPLKPLPPKVTLTNVPAALADATPALMRTERSNADPR